jgi:hypothetical protein
MTARDLKALEENRVREGCRKAATRRLRIAKGLLLKAQGHGRNVQRFAEREMECATAEAQEWGVTGGAR